MKAPRSLDRVRVLTILACAASTALAMGLPACADPDPAEVEVDTFVPDTADATYETDDVSGDAPEDVGADTPDSADVAAPDPAECDPLVPSVCAMPWPSFHYTVADPTTATGYRLSIGATALPANRDGTHIKPDRYHRLDGFSIGAPFLVHFPTLDPSTLPDEDSLDDSMSPDSPILLFAVGDDGTTLTQVPMWAEIDPREKKPENRALFLRPGVLLEEATRYIVVLRDLKAADGTDIVASEAYASLRDNTSAGTAVGARQAHFDDMFSLLTAHGVDRASTALAWDFVTASSESLHGDILKVRQDAFAHVETNGVPMTITEVVEYTPEQDADIAFEVRGTFEVADFQTPYSFSGVDWTKFARDAAGNPEQQGTRQAEFRARVPWSALDGTPHGILLHGHGLNGTHGQINGGHFSKLANTEDLIIVGANMIGMSQDDAPKIATMIFDLSDFTGLSERVQQALVEHLVLVKGMRDGFDQLPDISTRGVVVDPTQLFYNGISQGGIYGAALMALSTDITRGHLGVPGNNYSLLLLRSVDFDPFLVAMQITYPDSRDRALALSIIQCLWDSADPSSYYRHISQDLFPDTPSHSVLLASAKGDYQVALVSNEIAARSDVGVALMPGYGKEVPLVATTPYPHVGSALVNYDFGNPWPASGAFPPKDDLGDPHSKPRKLDAHNTQMMHFFRTGEVIDVCGGDGCTPD